MKYYILCQVESSGYALYSILNDHLHKFKNELSKNICGFSALKVINGEDKFKKTYYFIDYLIKSMNSVINDNGINFDALCDILRKVSDNDIQDKYPWAYKFFTVNKDRDEISESLTIKTLVCIEKSGLKFKGHPGVHGLSEGNGRFSVVIKSYKNIVWHEVAHLFGADDHYVENDKYEMKKKCTKKELCVMQYDPNDKPCSFCSIAIEEIKNGMFKERQRMGLDDLQ